MSSIPAPTTAAATQAVSRRDGCAGAAAASPVAALVATWLSVPAGAVANDAFQSAAGLDPSTFPAETWLGHYHKPHAIKRRKGAPPIRYVGSPDQVSAGEAGQEKALVVLNGAAAASPAPSARLWSTAASRAPVTSWLLRCGWDWSGVRPGGAASPNFEHASNVEGKPHAVALGVGCPAG